MAGPLQALLEEERINKEKLKARQRASVTEGYHRRSLPGGRASTNNIRRSMTPPPSYGNRDPHLEKLARPTAAFAQKQAAGAEKRQSLATVPATFAPPERELPKTSELTGEQREKFDAFLHRSTIQQKEKEKYLDMLRKKKETKDMQACTFEPEISKASRSVAHGTMLDRQKEMEARKAQRMKNLRQEQFDKEMSQCSFKPNLSRKTGEDRGSPANPRQSLSSKRGSAMTQSAGAIGMRVGAFSRLSESHAEDSEGSEYWDEEEDDYEPPERGSVVEVGEATLLPPDRQEEAQQRLQEKKRLQQASLTVQSPGVQGFAAALRKSASARQSQVLRVNDLPTPSFGSTDNETSSRSAPSTHGSLTRAAAKGRLVEGRPDSMEANSDESDADSPVLGGGRR